MRPDQFSHRIPNILPAHTGVRAIAALFVLSFHVTINARADWHGVDGIFRRGYLGVDLFFVLSGFIIHHVYRSKIAEGFNIKTYIKFLRYRLARIYPIHVVTMMIPAVVMLLSDHRSRHAFDAEGVIAGLLLVHGWFNIVAPNEVNWSVSAEWFVYLSYPLVMFSAFRRLPLTLRFFLMAPALAALHFFADVSPLFRVVPEFALGVVAYELAGTQLRILRSGRWLGIGVCAAIVLHDQVSRAEGLVFHSLAFAALIVCLLNPNDLIARVLAFRVFIYLGEISYSMYLVHALVRRVFRAAADHFHLNALSPAAAAVFMIMCVGVAICAYHCVELPARKLMRGRRAGAPQETTQVTGPLDIKPIMLAD